MAAPTTPELLLRQTTQLYASCSGRLACHSGRLAAGCLATRGTSRRLRSRVQVLASSDASSELRKSDRSRSQDPFAAAALRLQKLLAGLPGDGEEELVNQLLEAEPADAKLRLHFVAGGLVVAASLAICSLCGNDPRGGASLSVDSLRAALTGLLAAIPLVAFKAATWHPAAIDRFPALEEVHHRRVEYFKPLLSNLSTPQMALVALAEVVSSSVFLFPAAVGGIRSSLELYAERLGGLGFHLPAATPGLAALAVVATFAGIARALEGGVSDDEYEAVEAAMHNADRYYRVTAGLGSRPADAEHAATAFRAVAVAWLMRQEVAGNFAAICASCEVWLLGGLWFATGDLAAPLAAALASNCVDLAQLQRRLRAAQQPRDSA